MENENNNTEKNTNNSATNTNHNTNATQYTYNDEFINFITDTFFTVAGPRMDMTQQIRTMGMILNLMDRCKATNTQPAQQTVSNTNSDDNNHHQNDAVNTTDVSHAEDITVADASHIDSINAVGEYHDSLSN